MQTHSADVGPQLGQVAQVVLVALLLESQDGEVFGLSLGVPELFLVLEAVLLHLEAPLLALILVVVVDLPSHTNP